LPRDGATFSGRQCLGKSQRDRGLRVDRRGIEHRNGRIRRRNQQADLGAAEDDSLCATLHETFDDGAIGVARFGALDLTTAAPDRIVRAGLVQIPEGREILARLTVRENLELGAWARRDSRSAHREIAGSMEQFPILGQRRDLPAGQLSGGEQQILAIARGLLARPKLLLLDEPSLGLAPQMVDTVFEVIQRIHNEGVTILLVEQNALRALEIADRAYVVETGRILLSGSGASLRRNPEVQKAYLGG